MQQEGSVLFSVEYF